jgi:hypothetical protein
MSCTILGTFIDSNHLQAAANKLKEVNINNLHIQDAGKFMSLSGAAVKPITFKGSVSMRQIEHWMVWFSSLFVGIIFSGVLSLFVFWEPNNFYKTAGIVSFFSITGLFLGAWIANFFINIREKQIKCRGYREHRLIVYPKSANEVLKVEAVLWDNNATGIHHEEDSL